MAIIWATIELESETTKKTNLLISSFYHYTLLFFLLFFLATRVIRHPMYSAHDMSWTYGSTFVFPSYLVRTWIQTVQFDSVSYMLSNCYWSKQASKLVRANALSSNNISWGLSLDLSLSISNFLFFCLKLIFYIFKLFWNEK